MLTYLERFILDWGYVALFLGALIEGESIVLTISSMSYYGHFEISKVVLITFAGTMIADQSLFYLGRYFGPKIFRRFPKIQGKSQKAFDLLKRYEVPFILSFRFIYGIRIISPVVIGFSGIKAKKFSALNLFAAIIWTILSCGLGYCIGIFGNLFGFNNSSIALLFSFLMASLVILISHGISRIK